MSPSWRMVSMAMREVILETAAIIGACIAHEPASSLHLALGLAAVLPACARECLPQVRDGWIRLAPVKMPMMAGFGRIENHCPNPVTITGVSSPAFGDASLHETRIVDGVSRMRELSELRIGPMGGGIEAGRHAPDADAAADRVERGQPCRSRIRPEGRWRPARRTGSAQALSAALDQRHHVMPLRHARLGQCNRTAAGAIDPHHDHVAVAISVAPSSDLIRWPMVTLLLPMRSVRSSTTTSDG
jgi:hypothetical protein